MLNGFNDFKTATPGQIHDYYRSKKIHELSIEELAFAHLDDTCRFIQTMDGMISSSLFDLNQTVAASFSNVRTNQYVPLLACFSMLDQIGGLYKRTNKSCNYKNGIKKALHFYSNVTNAIELEQLTTLRHGLFHDGSLLYINSTTGTKVIFRMIQNSGALLTPAKKPWDGLYHNDISDYVTKIDLRELQNTTTEVIKERKKLLLDKKIKITAQTPQELFYKYLFKTNHTSNEEP